MEMNKKFTVVTVTVPEGWMPSLEACRNMNGNTRSGEIRAALQAHLVRYGFMSKSGKSKEA